MTSLLKNPSDIAQAAYKFVEQLEVTEKTKARYEEILWLFVESLKGDPSQVVESEEGEFLLKANWKDCYGGAIDSFLDYWLQRKFMGPDEVLQRAPGVLREFVEWNFSNGYFDREHYLDFILALPRGRAKGVKRLQKLGELLYWLHSPDPGAWAWNERGKVQTIHVAKKPDRIEEGYMTFVGAEGSNGQFSNDGSVIGPVVLTADIVKSLKKGDIANLTVGKYGDYWQVLESGNVYPEGTF